MHEVILWRAVYSYGQKRCMLKRKRRSIWIRPSSGFFSLAIVPQAGFKQRPNLVFLLLTSSPLLFSTQQTSRVICFMYYSLRLYRLLTFSPRSCLLSVMFLNFSQYFPLHFSLLSLRLIQQFPIAPHFTRFQLYSGAPTAPHQASTHVLLHSILMHLTVSFKLY